MNPNPLLSRSREKLHWTELGATGLEVPTSGLRAESFAFLSGGGKPTEELPITIVVYPPGERAERRAINDGRHRIVLAREAGAKFVRGRMLGYGPRGGVIWRFTGRIAI